MSVRGVAVLDSGAISALAERTPRASLRLAALRRHGLWPPLVPSVVLVECLTGADPADAATNRVLAACDVVVGPSAARARRAAALRHAARRGSALDAVVVASAEPGGIVLTGDADDIGALAATSTGVRVERL